MPKHFSVRSVVPRANLASDNEVRVVVGEVSWPVLSSDYKSLVFFLSFATLREEWGIVILYRPKLCKVDFPAFGSDFYP